MSVDQNSRSFSLGVLDQHAIKLPFGIIVANLAFFHRILPIYNYLIPSAFGSILPRSPIGLGGTPHHLSVYIILLMLIMQFGPISLHPHDIHVMCLLLRRLLHSRSMPFELLSHTLHVVHMLFFLILAFINLPLSPRSILRFRIASNHSRPLRSGNSISSTVLSMLLLWPRH